MITFQTITSAVSNNFKQSFTGRNDRLNQNPNRFERSPENDTFGYSRPRNQESELGSLDEFFGVAPKPEVPKAPCVIHFDESDCLPRDERARNVRPEVPNYSQVGNSDPEMMSLDEIFGEVQPKNQEPREPKIITFELEDRYPDAEEVQVLVDDNIPEAKIEVIDEIPEADIEIIDDIPEAIIEPVVDEIIPEIVVENDDYNALDNDMYEQSIRYEQKMQEEDEERRRKEQEDLDNELLIYGIGIPAMAIAAGMAFDGCDSEGQHTESNNPIIEDDFNNDNLNNGLEMGDDYGDSGFDDYGF